MKNYYNVDESKILNIFKFVIEKEFNMFEMHQYMDKLKSIEVIIKDLGKMKPDKAMSFEIPETICSEHSYEKNKYHMNFKMHLNKFTFLDENDNFIGDYKSMIEKEARLLLNFNCDDEVMQPFYLTFIDRFGFPLVLLREIGMIAYKLKEKSNFEKIVDKKNRIYNYLIILLNNILVSLGIDNNLYVYIQKKIKKQKDEIFADKFAVQFLNKYRIEIERMLSTENYMDRIID